MTKQIQAEMDKAVQRGVRYLDKNHSEWFKRINLNTLNLQACGVCILGQCFGDFWSALRDNLLDAKGAQVERDNDWAIRYGFNAPRSVDRRGRLDGETVNGSYEYLTYTWASYVAIRQVKARMAEEAGRS